MILFLKYIELYRNCKKYLIDLRYEKDSKMRKEFTIFDGSFTLKY